MSYVPTPPPDEPPPGEPPRPPGSRRDLWLGAVVGFVLTIGVPFLWALIAQAIGYFLPVLLSSLLVLVAGVVLALQERTRQWGLGILIGFAAALVVGAGACAVLLVSFSNSYGG